MTYLITLTLVVEADSMPNKQEAFEQIANYVDHHDGTDTSKLRHIVVTKEQI